ncbi:MAG: hypothetical protein ACK4RT_07205 [Erythrobacter sp.]
MQYFKLVRDGIDPTPFLAEIAANQDAFEANRGRQEKIAVQRESLAIPLRGIKASAIAGRKRRDVHESRWTTGSRQFPVARAFLKQAALAMDGLLSRAKIVCLPPGTPGLSSHRSRRILPPAQSLPSRAAVLGIVDAGRGRRAADAGRRAVVVRQ